ncbi:hypothetical protein GTW43_36815 [Streptomyces sp. SID5785]|uniref:hypothetical protein n=1 Tax=Streptomyces sp. SID5785 TaxID=2690309 RepID=UPI0013610325|nr:hypothetical protein [Streptomyces sp. SID5785]MZD10599.1 hypothetical protein [Streptomyces sp. SID5785]
MPHEDEKESRIQIGSIGRIASGDEAGKFVRIDELPDEPPSYLILLAYDAEFSRGCGDYWVEDRLSLVQFFTEGNWEVEWREFLS